MIALHRRFMAPAAPERLALVRILVGLFAWIYLWVQIPAFLKLATVHPGPFQPVGPLVVFSGAPPAPIIYLGLVLGLVLGGLFVRGAWFRWVGPAFAGVLLVLTSYRSSFGMVFHTENLMVLHVVALAAMPQAATALAPGRPSRAPPRADCGWPLFTLSLVTTLAYLLAGWAKVSRLGWAWTDGSVLMGHVAYDALRKVAVGSQASPFGIMLLDLPWLFAPLATLSLVLEIFAPFALLHRVAGWVWAAGVWAFHLGVAAMMLIGFPYPLSGVAFASLLPVERLLDSPVLQLVLRKITGSTPPSREAPVPPRYETAR